MPDSQVPDGFTLLDGVDSDYKQTTKGFNLDLPPGFSFPKSSTVQQPDQPGRVLYEHGIGEMEAYWWWELCTLSAAVHEHVAGREKEAQRYLHALIEGTQTPIYKAHVIETPGRGWADVAVRPALERGDYSRLFDALRAASEAPGFADAAKDAGHFAR